ncbi:MAG: Fe-S cluster assembly ATPase SufC [Candidatus Babeliaceae bacterium]
MFSLNNVSVSLDEKLLINALNLVCKPGTFTVLMGPNGSGKSSLAYALMGHPKYTIIDGSIMLDDVPITQLSADKRARAGLFLAFQYPYEIPGVSIFSFLKESYRALKGTDIILDEFVQLVETVFQQVGLSPDYIQRGVHEGFSGGERKRLEVAQLLLFKPKVAILDEIDSGLDADGIRHVAQALNGLRAENPSMIFIIITHNTRLLQFMQPDQVHILQEGKLIASGGVEMIQYIEAKGYRELV